MLDPESESSPLLSEEKDEVDEVDETEGERECLAVQAGLQRWRGRAVFLVEVGDGDDVVKSPGLLRFVPNGEEGVA